MIELKDYSPPEFPTLDQQRDALQKGLGRALKWTLSGRLDRQVLLNACLIDQRYDMQCEDNRGEWLWMVLNAARAVESVRNSILDALRSSETERTAYQLCQLAYFFAESGDAEFKAALYDFVARKPVPDNPWIGEGQLLHLDGETALLTLARARGSQLARREWDWDDKSIVDNAIEKLGAHRVVELLNAPPDSEVARFAEAWKHDLNKSESPRESRLEQILALSVSDILEAAYRAKPDVNFRFWGAKADECDLETVLHVLRQAGDPALLVNLLKVFSKRALPRFDDRLISLCQHDDEDVRRWARIAMEQNRHALVREFALTHLSEPNLESSVIGMLVRNYQSDDEQRILEQAYLPEDDWARHGMLMDILNLLEENPEADPTRLGLVAYADNPCESCRFRAVELLDEANVAPVWLLEECRSDSSEECREFVQTESDKL